MNRVDEAYAKLDVIKSVLDHIDWEIKYLMNTAVYQEDGGVEYEPKEELTDYERAKVKAFTDIRAEVEKSI